MRKRRHPFPTAPVLLSVFTIVMSVLAALDGHSGLATGWFIGFGTATILYSLLFWASPMNEAAE